MEKTRIKVVCHVIFISKTRKIWQLAGISNNDFIPEFILFTMAINARFYAYNRSVLVATVRVCYITHEKARKFS